jgi:hypothetical protein
VSLVLLAILSALIGFAVAQRFTVVALVPAVVTVMILASVDAATMTGSLFTFVSAGVVIAALQAGYFTGAMLRR